MTNENRARLKGMTDIIDLDDGLTAEEEQAQFNVFVADTSALPHAPLPLTIEPTSRAILPGNTAAYTLSVTSRGGLTVPVTLSLQGAPSGTTARFNPNPVTPPGTSRLHVTTTLFTAAGIYPMMVSGTTNIFTDTASLALIVTSVAPSFTLSISPTTRVAKPNQIVSYTVDVTRVNGFSQPVTFTAVGLPTGVGMTWSVNPVIPGKSSILTLAIPSRPSFGHHLLQLVGIADMQVVAKSVKLIIDYPFRIYLPIVMK